MRGSLTIKRLQKSRFFFLKVGTMDLKNRGDCAVSLMRHCLTEIRKDFRRVARVCASRIGQGILCSGELTKLFYQMPNNGNLCVIPILPLTLIVQPIFRRFNSADLSKDVQMPNATRRNTRLCWRNGQAATRQIA